MSSFLMDATSAAFGPSHTEHSEGMQIDALHAGQGVCP